MMTLKTSRLSTYLIAAGISVAIITVVGGLGTKLNSTFTSVKDALK